MNRLVVTIFSLLLLCSCASSAKINALQQELRREVQDIRVVQADQTNSLNDIREELRQLSGKLEEIQHSSQGKTRELEQTIQQLGSRVPPPAGVPEGLLSADEDKISKLSGDGADQYKNALARIRTGDFPIAKQLLTEFAQNNKGTAFTDNALFWLGIIHNKLGEYDQAVVSFSDVYQSYPAEDMVPASLYYLSEALENVGSKEDAKLTLEKLVDEHASSSFAMRAKVKLGLKKP